jgi:hypothetical protein
MSRNSLTVIFSSGFSLTSFFFLPAIAGVSFLSPIRKQQRLGFKPTASSETGHIENFLFNLFDRARQYNGGGKFTAPT